MNLRPLFLDLGHRHHQDAVFHLARNGHAVNLIIARQRYLPLEISDGALSGPLQRREEGLVSRAMDHTCDMQGAGLAIPVGADIVLASTREGEVQDVGRLGVEDVYRRGEGASVLFTGAVATVVVVVDVGVGVGRSVGTGTGTSTSTSSISRGLGELLAQALDKRVVANGTEQGGKIEGGVKRDLRSLGTGASSVRTLVRVRVMRSSGAV